MNTTSTPDSTPSPAPTFQIGDIVYLVLEDSPAMIVNTIIKTVDEQIFYECKWFNRTNTGSRLQTARLSAECLTKQKREALEHC